MTERMFRLLELHQKLDTALRTLKSGRSDAAAVARLTRRKLRLRDRLSRLALAPRPALSV
jgi:hypothetical protein